MIAQIETVPATGESIQFRGLKLTAAVADERRVREVLVETIENNHDQQESFS